MKKLIPTALASLALLQVISLQAQTTVHTDPVGFINLTIKGANPDPAFTALSVPMISPVLYSGQFDGGAGFVLTDSGANWTADQINAYKARDGNDDATHYLEVTNHTDNTKVGMIVKIFDATSTTLTAQVDVSDLDGASYTIRKYQTLAGLFKDKVGVAGGLKAGSGANDADRVYKLGPDGAGGVEWFTYYYETGRSGGAWKRIGSSNPMDDVAIAHDEGLIVRRIEAGDVELTVPGGVKSNTSHKEILPGFNFVSVSYPVNKTLSELGLYTGDSTSGVSGGSDVSADGVDRVYYLNDEGSFDMFYYFIPARSGTESWQKFGVPSVNQNDFELKAGRPIVVNRRVNSSFEWTLTSPIASN